MEKKDWKDRLREFPFIRMYLLREFKANNPREQGMADILTLVKDKEFYDLIDFISQELDKARDKAKIEVLTEIFQTCYQEDSKTLELVEEKLSKLSGEKNE